jgi:ABC-type nickel/cobalt efflux system permease component RcnA
VHDGGALNGLLDDDLSAGVVIGALLLAMGWGALHSLSPGHGKTMVAAYLVGTRGTARHALILGAFVTVTHTAGVVALGLVTLLASRYVLPEDLFPWINLVAALLVVAVGLWAGRGRIGALRRRLAHDRAHRLGSPHHHHGPGGHTHDPPQDLSVRSLMAVGASAGLIPCPSALVLLLGAIALDRVGYGLVLVVAFSLGLAGLLSVIGLLVLYARRLVDRLPLDGRIVAAAPAASAMVIVALGIVLTVRALPGVL